jgi:hypothetical protein
VAVDWKLQNPDWRGVAKAAGPSRPTGGARALLVEDDPSFLPLGDYVPGMHVMRLEGPPVKELSVIAAVECGSSDCHLPVAALDTSLHLPGFRPVGTVRRINQFAIYRLRATSPVRLTRAQIEHALQGAPVTSFGLFIQPPA